MFFRRKAGKVLQSFRNYSKSAAKELYILSAVRTPIGLQNGVLNEFTAPHLLSFAVNEALQRAIVPPEDILNVFLGCPSYSSCNKEIIKRLGLIDTVEVSLSSTNAIKSFIDAARFLLRSTQTVCLSGGMVSISNYEEERRSILKPFETKHKGLEEYIKLDYKNLKNARRDGVFYDEITKIIFKKKGKQILVSEDELPDENLGNCIQVKEAQLDFEYSPTLAEGAVAFVIATEDYIKKNQLMPIAKIISFAEEPLNFEYSPSTQLHAIEKALEIGECQHSDIAQWEIDSATSDMFLTFMSQPTTDLSLVNKDGGVFSLGYPIGLSGAKGLCHLAHSLIPGGLGCASSCDLSGAASAVIIEKCYRKNPGKPRLTLFTKKPCPLCDHLREQLKPFQSRFSLSEVDIEGEGNAKYNGLYEYEIPVLFLEGRFLCKHKLDGQHFNRRLSEFENFA